MGSPHQARILIVDDYAPWREQLRSLLRTRPEWNIIGEASDGQDAVEKAIELQPDIILLDVGMPSLNGIEAARRIRQLSPNCKIVILTQDGNEDLMTAAFEAGALAYVLKAEMTIKLIPAIQAALGTRC